MLGALGLYGIGLLLNDLIETVEDVSDQFIVDVLNMIGDLLDVVGHHGADLDWDIDYLGLLRELALGVQLEDVVSVFGGKHQVASDDSLFIGDPNIDNIGDFHCLQLEELSWLGQSDLELDHVGLCCDLRADSIYMSV